MRYHTSPLALLIFVFCILSAPLHAQLKVACVGDDNTLGGALAVGQSYPEHLQNLLGAGFAVENFGVANATYRQGEAFSYWSHPRMDDLIAYEPDVVIINLGLEDTQVGWSKYQSWFLFERIRFMTSNPRVIVCKPLPVFNNALGYDDSDLTQVNVDLESIAGSNEIDWLDTRAPFVGSPELFADGVYLNAEGAESFATVVAGALQSMTLKDRIAISVVGDSITEGSNTDFTSGDKEGKRYTGVLWDLLGRDDYVVHNFGKSGTTLLQGTNMPYYTADGGKFWNYSHDCHPDMVVVMLGTNDAKSSYDGIRDTFGAEAEALIETYKVLPSNPQIFVCLPPQASGGFGIIPATITNVIVPELTAAANAKGVNIIDLHSETISLHDGVHPNTAGAAKIGEVIFNAIKAVEASGQGGSTPSVVIRAISPSAMELEWQTENGVQYEILYSEDLVDFDPLNPPVIINGDGGQATHEVPMNGESGFYRVGFSTN